MDKKSGYGVYEWENGWLYKGNFDNDLRNGFGELYEGEKLVYRGFWRNGEQTEEEVKIKGDVGFDAMGSKTFSKTNSQVYNRKSGSAHKLQIYDDYGIHFNPEEKFR